MRFRAPVRATLALVVVCAALTAQAQPVGRVPVVGVLRPHAPDSSYPAFIDGLRNLGYEDGRSVRLVVRSADMKLERLPGLAKELVDAQVDVIVAITTPGTRAAVEATRNIPIVMAIVGDPVAMGFVKNLSRPGGNVTGVSNLTAELASKRLQIVKEVVPTAKRVAVMWLAGQSDAFMAPTVELATGRKLATMFPNIAAPKLGALMAYAADHREQYRRAAAYVDKLLKGARPADVPVEQPTKFVLSVNLKVARAIGVTIPQSILLQADEVIQ